VPFPATWKLLRNVGVARRKGSDATARSDAQIYCFLWSRQPARRTTADTILFEIRCSHVLGLSEEPAPSPATGQAPCPDSRQCPLSPRHTAATLACGKASRSFAFFSSAVQPGVESRRKGIEAGEKDMYSQSTLSTARRFDRRCNKTIRVVEETKQYVTPIMRHYLSRVV